MAGVVEKVRRLLDKAPGTATEDDNNHDDVQTCIEFADNELQNTTFADHTEDAPVRRTVRMIKTAHALKLENQALKLELTEKATQMQQASATIRGLVLENDRLRRRNVTK